MTTGAQRLKFLAGINARTLPETTDPEFEFRYIDIGSVGRGQLMVEPETIRFGEAPSRARRVVRTGDCLVSTVRTYLRAVLPVGPDLDGMIASTGFAALTPGPRLEPRYLGWVAQSDPFIEEIVARSTGVSYPAINALEIGNLEIPAPPVEVQRAIADYLDTETARIDTLIAKKQDLIGLLHERLDTFVDNVLEPWRGPWNSLGRASGGLTVGVVVNPSSYVDEDGEVIYLRGVNVFRHHLELGAAQRMSRENALLLSKSRLQAGDVVAIRVGDPGVAALVPPEGDGANCASLLIIRQSNRLRGDFLTYLLNSPYGRGQMRALANGAAQLQVNVSDAVHFKVPVRSAGQQAEAVRRLDAERRRVAKLVHDLTNQVELLIEHRQALITAAVTGESSVLGVAS